MHHYHVVILSMSSPSSQTAKFLSTMFVENLVNGAGFTAGVLSVASIWVMLGDRFTAFDLNRTMFGARRNL